MNAPILRVFVLFLVLFATLVGFSSNWAVFDADELEERVDNRRATIETATIKRGTIGSIDGTAIAVSEASGRGNLRIYERTYPEGALFAHPVGYSFIELPSTGIERAENAVLIGEENEFATLLDELRGVPQEGSNLTVTLDAEAQQIATTALQNASSNGISPNGGSVVAIEPATGAIRVMASVPGYDPSTIPDPRAFSALNRDPARPLINRATQLNVFYPPGSTFKVVTASAALDSGEFTPDTVLSGASPQVIGGADLSNAGGAQFGDIPMTTALTNSVNTYWAQVGEQLGTETMFEYMERFGFGADPELNYPTTQLSPSGVYNEEGELLGPGDSVDIGRVAIGQGPDTSHLEATPLQMAQVAATIANGGVLMRPTFVQEITDPDGRTSEELDPEEQTRVVSEETAAQVTDMMVSVTEEGTASALSVDAVSFAGKTGTAEIDVATSLNQPWFIGFAPADDPQIAIAATIDRCTGCFGGEVAGPIATQVMEALLN